MTDSRVPTDRKRLRESLFVPPYHKRQLTDYQLGVAEGPFSRQREQQTRLCFEHLSINLASLCT